MLSEVTTFFAEYTPNVGVLNMFINPVHEVFFLLESFELHLDGLIGLRTEAGNAS